MSSNGGTLRLLADAQGVAKGSILRRLVGRPREVTLTGGKGRGAGRLISNGETVGTLRVAEGGSEGFSLRGLCVPAQRPPQRPK
jgi:hypothetical protein